MQVILIQDVNNLGGANELVTVKNGYGRNFLIPRKLAVEANPSNLKQLEERRKQLAKKEEKLLAEINSVIAVLQNLRLKLALKQEPVVRFLVVLLLFRLHELFVNRKVMKLTAAVFTIIDEVKELGTYKAKIDFGKGQEIEVEFEVVAE